MSDFMFEIFTLMDSSIPSDWWDRHEVRQAAHQLEQAKTAIEETLTPEQAVLWDQYQNAQADMTQVDDFALFENTLALGIELGRLSAR